MPLRHGPSVPLVAASLGAVLSMATVAAAAGAADGEEGKRAGKVGQAFHLKPISRVDADQLGPYDLYEHMARREPLIIAGVASEELLGRWTFRSFPEKCGNAKATEGISNHFVSIIDTLPSEMRLNFDARLKDLFGTSLDEYRKILLKDYTIGSLFEHMQRFRNANLTWRELPDYALPLTLHDWSIAECDALVADIAKYPIPLLVKYGMDWDKYQRIRSSTREKIVDGLSKTGLAFQAPAHSRAYPLHRHEQINENFMLIFEGTKRFVVFNRTEGEHLYPIKFFARTEFDSELYDNEDRVFGADALNPDLRRQPKLAHANGYEGTVRKGDLIYIPCDSIHGVQNEEDVFAVAWHIGTEYCEADRLLRHAMGESIKPFVPLAQARELKRSARKKKKRKIKKQVASDLDGTSKGKIGRDEL